MLKEAIDEQIGVEKETFSLKVHKQCTLTGMDITVQLGDIVTKKKLTKTDADKPISYYIGVMVEDCYRKLQKT